MQGSGKPIFPSEQPEPRMALFAKFHWNGPSCFLSRSNRRKL